jgi:hypothetical protein
VPARPIARRVKPFEAAELVEQLPELPLTPVIEFTCSVLAELLQLYAFAIGDVGAKKMANRLGNKININKVSLAIQVRV